MDAVTIIKNLLAGLIPLSSLPSFAWNIVPRQVYALVATIAVHVSAFIETHVAEITPALGADSRPVVFLNTVKADLDSALPAGSAVLRVAVPKILAAVQAYIAPSTPATSPVTKALAVHVQTVELQAAADTANAALAAAQSAASQQVGVDITADPVGPLDGTDPADGPSV